MTPEPISYRPHSTRTAPTTAPRRRGLLLAATLASTLTMTAVSGCATGSSDSTAVSTWADSVCRATADLDHSLHSLGSELTTDLSTAESTLDQAKEQVRRRLDVVASDAQTLGNAVGAAPETASEPVQQQQQQLRTDEARAARAVQELQQAATGITAADTTPELATQATIAAATWTAATQDVDRFLRSVQQLATSGTAEVRTAFSQAPRCAQLSARPSPAPGR